MSPSTNSDSEDDLDYVPPADESDSESSDDHFELGAVAGSMPVVPLMDPEQKRQRDALWASFQASVAPAPKGNGDGSGSETGNRPKPASAPAERVKIERTYLFAGKHVTEVVEVPGDSEEAKKWPRWSPRIPTPDVTSGSAPAPTSFSQTEKDAVKAEGEVKREHNGDSPALPPAAPTTTPTFTLSPDAKRPGPRKSRTALPSIPKGPQAKKITTLDKCTMDWRSHLASQSSDVKDELDANRRGGGYLEKVDFLKRVEDRREDVFEANKANKRRKT